MATSGICRIKNEDCKVQVGLHELRKGTWGMSTKVTVVSFGVGLSCFVYLVSPELVTLNVC